jgi:hypothetical protein
MDRARGGRPVPVSGAPMACAAEGLDAARRSGRAIPRSGWPVDAGHPAVFGGGSASWSSAAGRIPRASSRSCSIEHTYPASRSRGSVDVTATVRPVGHDLRQVHIEVVDHGAPRPRRPHRGAAAHRSRVPADRLHRAGLHRAAHRSLDPERSTARRPSVPRRRRAPRTAQTGVRDLGRTRRLVRRACITTRAAPLAVTCTRTCSRPRRPSPSSSSTWPCHLSGADHPIDTAPGPSRPGCASCCDASVARLVGAARPTCGPPACMPAPGCRSRLPAAGPPRAPSDRRGGCGAAQCEPRAHACRNARPASRVS